MNEQELIGYLLLEMEKQNIHITCDDCFPKMLWLISKES